MHTLQRELFVPRPLPEVFAFFSRPANLQKITPPWLHFNILTPEPIEMKSGATILYKLKVHGVPMSWITEIEQWRPPYSFSDIQRKGPYKTWRHTHTFMDHNGGTLVGDQLEYELPLGPIGRLAHAFFVQRDVESIFDYRVKRIASIFA